VARGVSTADGPANRLARESSPYLLLHAHNPVDWYPWGDEAFARARAEDKPIFLSVGYSTCHWCHVMERESFSNAAIAQQLNQGFVSVKVDREERPDLDEIYMLATQLMTQQGGWPNSVFLTHDLKPFFAGTYFPPDDRYGRPGFPRLLTAIGEAWTERRESVLEQAEELAGAIRGQLGENAGARALPPASVVAATQAALAKRFDRQYGGFGGAPKFPSPSNLVFLLDRVAGGDDEARDMLSVTLDAMARGGLQDQLAGGFHRYSTDEHWLVPHFEKMLYDNASLAGVYAAASLLLRRGDCARVARATVDFCAAELRGPHAGFLSAIDADTDGEEGAYYTWTAAELRGALSVGQSALLGPALGFDGSPNFEGARYVLYLPVSWEERARSLGLTSEELLARAEPGRVALLAARTQRPRPMTDDKVLSDWNGLMIGACADVGRLLGEPNYVALAAGAAEFVLKRLRNASGDLVHTFREDQAHIGAFLDDYAFLVQGLLALHAATGERRWLDEALRLQDEQDRRLWDESAGGYFQAGAHPHLLVRSKSGTDGALPSGNGIAALNLLRLGELTGDAARRARVRRILESFGEVIGRFPLGHVTLVQALARLGESSVATADAPRAGQVLETLAESVVGVAAENLAPVSAVAGPQRVRVSLSIAPGWHVNAHMVTQPYLIATRVESPDVVSVSYPPAARSSAGAGIEPLDIYRGTIAIDVELALGVVSPELTVTLQPCDEQRCLPAVSWTLSPAGARLESGGAWVARRNYAASR
jgi:uncharacterized protein